MKIVEAKEFGGPEVLVPREVPDPVPTAGQVVVRVAAVDTLFVDTQIRSGWGGGFFGITTAYVPGGGVSGEVIAVGDGVDPAVRGRRVITYTGDMGGYGASAEQVVVAAEGLIPVPDGLDLITAAALVHDGVTALGLIETAAPKPGEWVLVVGATGSMGILLVQLASTAGAHVVAAARGQEKLDLARRLGARAAVDYSEPGWARRVRDATGGHGADVVFDGVGGAIGRTAFDAVAHGGRFSAHGAPTGQFAELDAEAVQRRGVTLRGIGDVQYDLVMRRQLAARALDAAAAGRLKPVIGKTFPLAEAADAHAAVEARAVIGKILLIPENRNEH